MMNKRNTILTILLALIVIILAACGGNQAGTTVSKETAPNNGATPSEKKQEWTPSKIEMIISHDLGGSTDATLRVLGKIWSEKLGASNMVFNNKDGAAQRIGYDFYLQQSIEPDNLKLLGTNLGSAAIMYKDQEPDWVWEEALTPIGVFANDPGEIFVREDSEFQTIEQLIEEAKHRTLTVGIASWQSMDNIVLQQIMQQTGANFQVVTFDSSGKVVTNVLGGHVDFGYQKAAAIARADGFRVLAITQDDNPIPEMNNNAPVFNDVMGTKIVENSSYRSVLISKEFADKNPDVYNQLRETFEEAIKDERFIEEMGKLEVNKSMIVDYDKDKVNQTLADIFSVYDEYRELLESGK